MVDIYPPLFNDPEGDSCLSILPNQTDKKIASSISSSETFAKSEYPSIFRVTGANQIVRKLLSTDLVNTKYI